LGEILASAAGVAKLAHASEHAATESPGRQTGSDDVPWRMINGNRSASKRRFRMAYSAEVSRGNPSCFLFLIDQSGSMQEVLDATNIQSLDRPVAGDIRAYTQSASARTKAQGVADAINRLLQNLVIKCAKSEGVRDYYHVGVVGYGGDGSANRVSPAFSGTLAGRELVPISEIANNPARVDERTKKVDDGAGGLVDQTIKFPVWFEPVASGGTPMCQALKEAESILQRWIQQHMSAFPPIVINITDGEPTDGDPIAAAAGVRSLCTTDGNALLFNVHISSQKSAPIEFPDSEGMLPDQHARLLFNMSSLLPSYMQAMARQEGIQATEATRGFVFNADMVAVIRFLDIGTRPSNLR